MKMELRYLRQDRFVRVMRKANSPPNTMATTQVPTASSTVLMQRHPQVAHGKAAGEKVDVVDEGIAAGLTRQVGVDGARVDLEGILHDGDDGGDGGHRQHDAHNEQDDIMGL